MDKGFNGLGVNLGNLSRLSDAKTRSISAENFTGEKGKGGMAVPGRGDLRARDLGVGWKVSPCVTVQPGEVFEAANIKEPGAIQHIWMTLGGKSKKKSRFTILRIYWDDCEYPSVECPIGDFFASAFETYNQQLSSLAVCVNPRNGYNCYWEMPFRQSCRITIENIASEEVVLFYQVDYTLTEVPDNCGYFHARFNRVNPLPYKEVYTILDGVQGKGQYVGTYMTWGVNNNGWWGEGEIKFYMDGDKEFPTICGTGTEDYFCGSFNFDVDGRYTEFTTPYAGMPAVMRPDGLYQANTRFSLYRWHIVDPIRFDSDLKVTIQALGWRDGGRYLPLQDDLSSVAFWYQTMPGQKFPTLLSKDELEII